jgi:hypothetical protein
MFNKRLLIIGLVILTIVLLITSIVVVYLDQYMEGFYD